MKQTGLVSVLALTLFFVSCASTPPLPGAEKTATVWQEIYECVRHAPPGKSCGSLFKSNIFTAQISAIKKDKTGQFQLVSRFGSGDKAFKCEIPEESVPAFSKGEIIHFHGTVIGISSQPMQKSVQFKDCIISKLRLG